jgi:SAM-dependent methyltransferase
VILPPGTILQNLYLKERLGLIPPGRFIEIGAGQGVTSHLLLELGWTGEGYELNPESAQSALRLNEAAVKENRYRISRKSWFNAKVREKVDMVISCMVLEHFSDREEKNYFRKAKTFLKQGGKAVLLVPSCMDYWGIEDEIAGHYRRYSFAELEKRTKRYGWKIRHLAGLTYPLSNVVFPLSNFLVARYEAGLKGLSLKERTRLSGNRKVPMKTHYPPFLGLLLNEVVMYPFHLLQKWNTKNRRCMVLYAECVPS